MFRLSRRNLKFEGYKFFEIYLENLKKIRNFSELPLSTFKILNLRLLYIAKKIRIFFKERVENFKISYIPIFYRIIHLKMSHLRS